jgi:hypothetical protein
VQKSGVIARSSDAAFWLPLSFTPILGYLGNVGSMEGRPHLRFALPSAIARLLIAGALFTPIALAQDKSKITPVILSPTNDAVVTSPVTVVIELKSATNDAAGQMGDMHHDEHYHGAHPHLIIDFAPPPDRHDGSSGRETYPSDAR